MSTSDSILNSLVPHPPKEAEYTVPVNKDGAVWMIRDSKVSVARAIATDVMFALNMNPDDWRTRDKIIDSIYKRVEGILDYVKHNSSKL